MRLLTYSGVSLPFDIDRSATPSLARLATLSGEVHAQRTPQLHADHHEVCIEETSPGRLCRQQIRAGVLVRDNIQGQVAFAELSDNSNMLSNNTLSNKRP